MACSAAADCLWTLLSREAGVALQPMQSFTITPRLHRLCLFRRLVQVSPRTTLIQAVHYFPNLLTLPLRPSYPGHALQDHRRRRNILLGYQCLHDVPKLALSLSLYQIASCEHLSVTWLPSRDYDSKVGFNGHKSVDKASGIWRLASGARLSKATHPWTSCLLCSANISLIAALRSLFSCVLGFVEASYLSCESN